MIKAITGTKDILPSEISKWYFLESIVKKKLSNFNYKEIRTPIFENTTLFARGIGEGTDIVSKEMYTFLDRSGESITLRPELTASVVRAFIEHSLEKKQSLNKFFYIGPMFRQERPQAGRYRQFHQFGAEALGSNDPLLDAEMIIIAYDILSELGLKNLEVKINSLGVPSEREVYKNELKEYLKNHFSKLSEESKKRFNTNVLRIFDSKDERDIEIMKKAPLLINYLNEESLNHFEVVKSTLKNANIHFVVDSSLVRGLDYYTHTTFEIVSGSVGSQSALCGGGRYNGLIKELGGSDLPGVGFAAGMERILLACENENILNLPEDKIDLYIVTLDKSKSDISYKIAVELRRKNKIVELDYLSRSVKAQMREANKFNAKFVLFVGGEELNKNEVILKNMIDGTQENISLSDIDKLLYKLGE
ncbi:MAG: histidine--tRNA ligase [Stygiobacter sp.]